MKDQRSLVIAWLFILKELRGKSFLLVNIIPNCIVSVEVKTTIKVSNNHSIKNINVSHLMLPIENCLGIVNNSEADPYLT